MRALAAALAIVALASTAVAATRFDPYKSYRFRLSMEGRPVAAFQTAQRGSVSADVVKHRAGGDPSTAHKSPGRSKFEAVTLERGLTQDSDFRDWVEGVGGASEPRRDLELTGDAAGGAGRQSLRRCWVADHSKLPTLGAGGNAVAIEHIHLACENVSPHH
ncbi:MAG TPA: phage tail protein [Caulobacteraceae bacterium]|nr:phage tail protein [Caulobacteraceae bacterium]